MAAPVVLACNGEARTKALEAPLGPVPLVDVDPDPDAIEVSIVAAPGRWAFLPGKPADVWSYRDGNVDGDEGRVPGPMLLGKLGDRVTVHFRNELPEPTTLHWHGIKVPALHDGSNVSQMAVDPGESFTYEFTFTEAGTFWFHPHLSADEQIERGLYAPIVVRGEDDIAVDADRMLVLDDVKVESSGVLSPTITGLDLMVGRQGNVLLVNGERLPRFEAAAGGRERWRLLNTANGTYFNVGLPGHRLRVIGLDGGLLPEPYEVDAVVIAPGERYELLVELGGVEGDTLELQTQHYDRGHDLPDQGPRPLATFALTAPPASPANQSPAPRGQIDPLPVTADTPRRSFTLSEQEPANPGDEPRFFINDEAYPDVTRLVVGTDEVEVWEIVNDAEMDHPFHLHGTFFQVLDQPHLGWKDTVNVPRKSTVRIAVDFDNPGLWMYHCHILEHAERGMMGILQVGPSP
ncbi:multicopper oxidase family protein [Nannocystis radixulma]|uniref:Multicopper oxidase family protein n=1 Tax=Nannocystis radixulma TaxID=2995305 RepID=A0ABT5BPC1_9BACT|nr:multicopper oxidase family protein [Nannocystis radixulma]MDC0675415.1 multicopper oxidase family protein [Nannocystis radixulma]